MEVVYDIKRRSPESILIPDDAKELLGVGPDQGTLKPDGWAALPLTRLF